MYILYTKRNGLFYIILAKLPPGSPCLDLSPGYFCFPIFMWSNLTTLSVPSFHYVSWDIFFKSSYIFFYSGYTEFSLHLHLSTLVFTNFLFLQNL